MKKEVILTGLRANNDLTLGNYFGAMLPIIDMARKHAADYQINMFIPDLHSFTTPVDHSVLYGQILNNAKVFAAAGLPLDNDNIFLYRQSYISAHSELTWILDCFTGMGEMRRMTQFKDKTKTAVALDEAVHKLDQMKSMSFIEQAESYETLSSAQLMLTQELAELINIISKIESKQGDATVGLFNYPVLMAADILLYGAKYVPVGDDQTQHLEFTRDIATRMNNRFGELFVVPEPVAKQHAFFGNEQGLRIMDLQTPTKKMSKSDETGKGVIFLSDSPEAAAKKIMSATTDDKACVAFDRANQPGISNLLEILALIRKHENLDQVIAEFEGAERYGDFKRIVATEVSDELRKFQQNLAEVDDAVIMNKLTTSEAAMREQASETLLRVQQAVGLRPQA